MLFIFIAPFCSKNHCLSIVAYNTVYYCCTTCLINPFRVLFSFCKFTIAVSFCETLFLAPFSWLVSSMLLTLSSLRLFFSATISLSNKSFSDSSFSLFNRSVSKLTCKLLRISYNTLAPVKAEKNSIVTTAA